MSIRVLALALLASVAVAEAAPPKSQKPTTDEAAQQQAPEALDVDAMARAKDEAADTPPPSEPTSDASPAVAPASDAAPPETAVSATPPSASPPPVEASPVAPTPVPAEPAPTPDTTAPTAESPAEAEQRSLAASCVARATNMLDDAQKADFGGATRDFDAKMRTDMPAAKLKQQWDSLAHAGAEFDADGDGVEEAVFYNGYRAGTDLVGPSADARGDGSGHGAFAHHLGLEHMAATGVQGRGVLIDLAHHLGHAWRGVDRNTLEEIMAADNVVVEKSDVDDVYCVMS